MNEQGTPKMKKKKRMMMMPVFMDEMNKRELNRCVMILIASAGIERIGEESPVSTIATDTFVMKEIAQLVKDAEEEEEEEEEGEIKSIMVCGGQDERWQPVSRVEIFSISENELQFAPDLIHPRFAHGIGRIEDQIFKWMNLCTVNLFCFFLTKPAHKQNNRKTKKERERERKFIFV